MPRSPLLAAGAALCAVAVLAGAFGAHALAGRLAPDALALWETAARYLMYGGLGAVVAAVAGPAARLAGHLVAGGAAVFAATVFALALGGPRWLGAVTPLGGAALAAGFAALAWAALRGRGERG